MIGEPDNIITLSDEDGNDMKFEFLDLIRYNDEEYVVLLPIASDDEAMVMILKVLEAEEDSDEEVYGGVEDQNTLNAVFEIFRDRFRDELED